MTGLQVAGRALRNRNIMAAEFAFAGFSIVEHGSWLAILLYAFDQGGVAEAGIVASAMLIPAAALAPFVSAGADRLPPSRGLAVGFGVQGVSAAVIGAAMAVDAPAIVVYLAATVLTIAITMSRPTMSAALPAIASGPAELAAANSMAGFIETTGSFTGPAAAGFMLLVAPPAATFAASAAVLALAAGLALTIRPFAVAAGIGAVTTEPAFEPDPRDDDEDGGALTQVLEGVRLVRSEPAPRLLVLMLASAWIVFGALDVALVAIAVEQMGRSEATAGLLGSALGFGGVVGAGLSLTLIGRRRLSLPVAIGLVAVGLPVMALAAVDSLTLVVVLLALTGLGDAVSDVAGRTMLQGLAAEDTLARVFGVLEGLATAALAIGSIGFSLLAVTAGIEVALLAVGAVMPLFLLTRFTKLRDIDRARPTVDGSLLALIRRIPIFAPLPAFRVEQLLVNLTEQTVEPRAQVFGKGEYGDRLYLVAEGSAVVELPTRTAEHHVGGFFGEIALLKNEPRMATVRAGDDGLVAYTLDRDVFLQAITDFPRSRSRTVREAERRLGEA
ncbi:MAG: cyclic nucleotide-binding domain-containing protein [Acidimicrobiales bacterium]